MAEGPRQPHLPLPALPSPARRGMAGSQLSYPGPQLPGTPLASEGFPGGAVRRAVQPPRAGREGVWRPGGTARALPLAHGSPRRGRTPRPGLPGTRCPRSSPHTPAPAPRPPLLRKGSESFPRDRSTFLGLYLMGLSVYFYLLTGKKPRCPDAVPGLW